MVSILFLLKNIPELWNSHAYKPFALQSKCKVHCSHIQSKFRPFFVFSFQTQQWILTRSVPSHLDYDQVPRNFQKALNQVNVCGWLWDMTLSVSVVEVYLSSYLDKLSHLHRDFHLRQHSISVPLSSVFSIISQEISRWASLIFPGNVGRECET